MAQDRADRLQLDSSGRAVVRRPNRPKHIAYARHQPVKTERLPQEEYVPIPQV